MSRKPAPSAAKTSHEGDRIAKVIARAGIASRREAEKLIEAGRVSVNGAVITRAALNVTDKDRVTVDGKPLDAPEPPRLWLYHKPTGLVTTTRDPEGRPTIFDELPADLPRVMTVGRLDLTSEGLLLLTNDGELAHRLMHPSFEVPKTYLATLNGTVPRGLGKKLRAGVELDDGPVTLDDFAVVDAVPGKTMVRVTLHEGRKRIVRRLLAAVGFPVQELVRTDIGAVTLGDQRPGSIRVLTRKEVGELYQAVGL